METFFGQIIALITFFAFPAIKYVLLKKYSAREGNPELWYLPAYGFRLVIRNLPGKKTLSGIKYRVRLRGKVSPCDGSSVATLDDVNLIESDDTFLFPGTDQVLISFQLKRNTDGSLLFVHTDKLGNKIFDYVFKKNNRLIADYEANLENWFNFDIKIAKRVEINFQSFSGIFDEIMKNSVEQEFSLTRIRSVG